MMRSNGLHRHKVHLGFRQRVLMLEVLLVNVISFITTAVQDVSLALRWNVPSTGKSINVMLHLEIAIQDGSIHSGSKVIDAVRDDIAVIFPMQKVIIRRKLELSEQGVVLMPMLGTSDRLVIQLSCVLDPDER